MSLELAEKMSPQELLNEEIKLKLISFNNEKKPFLDVFKGKLQQERSEEQELQRQSRQEYFQQSLDKLLLLRKNDLMDEVIFKQQIEKLNSFHSLDREQDINYDVGLFKALRKIKLAGQEDIIGMQAREQDFFQNIKNNPEMRMVVEKRYREAEKSINQALEKYGPEKVESYLYNLISKEDLEQSV